MFDRAIVPLDGSSLANSALRWARRMPARSLHLLRVEPEMDMIIRSMVPHDVFDFREREIADAEAALAAAAATLGDAGKPVTTEVRFGDDPAEVIVDEATRADVIVMATSGRGTLGRAILGSTADRVARHAVAPTLFVRPGIEETEPARIVVPIDGSPRSEDALPAAAALARDLGLPVLLIRVVDMEDVLREIHRNYPQVEIPKPDTAWDDSRRTVEAEATRHLAAIGAPLEAQGIRVSNHVDTGTAAQSILEAVEPSDLIVMTSHGRGGIGRWLIGSVADKLIRQAPAPVLMVRPS
jgi:nucleotide-binding universal stress UspA family protein